MKNPKYCIFKDKKGEFRFNLKAGNGQIILASEGYTAKAGCKNGIKSVQKNGTNDARYELRTAKNGKVYFVLAAANKEEIGRSQMYKSASGRRGGVKSVKKNCVTTNIEDLS